MQGIRQVSKIEEEACDPTPNNENTNMMMYQMRPQVFFCWKIQVSLSQDKTTHYRVFTVMYCQFAILDIDIAIILPHYIYFKLL